MQINALASTRTSRPKRPRGKQQLHAVLRVHRGVQGTLYCKSTSTILLNVDGMGSGKSHLLACSTPTCHGGNEPLRVFNQQQPESNVLLAAASFQQCVALEVTAWANAEFRFWVPLPQLGHPVQLRTRDRLASQALPGAVVAGHNGLFCPDTTLHAATYFCSRHSLDAAALLAEPNAPAAGQALPVAGWGRRCPLPLAVLPTPRQAPAPAVSRILPSHYQHRMSQHFSSVSASAASPC
jgi:hypothetical protein